MHVPTPTPGAEQEFVCTLRRAILQARKHGLSHARLSQLLAAEADEPALSRALAQARRARFAPTVTPTEPHTPTGPQWEFVGDARVSVTIQAETREDAEQEWDDFCHAFEVGMKGIVALRPLPTFRVYLLDMDGGPDVCELEPLTCPKTPPGPFADLVERLGQ